MANQDRAGFSISEWVERVGICRGTYYNLPASLAPQRVNVGRKPIIIEEPRDWLKRVAEQQRLHPEREKDAA
jgi:hypothetical protein